MALQYRDIETKEIVYANQAQRMFELFMEGNYKGTMVDLYDGTKRLDLDLRERKNLKILALKEQCTASIHSGFSSSSTGHSFGLNDYDQANFTQQVAVMAAGAKGNVRWKTKDSGPVEFTPEDFMGIIVEAKNYKEQEQEKYWDLEQAALNAETDEEVHAVSWDEEGEK